MNVRRFFGITLIVVGVLIAVTTGGCALVFGLSELFAGPSDLGLLPIILVLGVVPCIVGVAIAWLGVRLVRSAAATPDPTTPPD
jgi:hypothetical protein